MSKILSTALLATAATAQLTTSVWMPGAPVSGISWVGSVVSVQNDHTILSVSMKGIENIGTEYAAEMPQTITVGGTTFIAYEATATEDDFTATVALQCERANGDAAPTCTATTNGSGPETTIAATDSDAAVMTTTMGGDMAGYMNNFPLVITAGEDKLSGASAAATPTASGAQSTGSASPAASANSSAAKSNAASAASSGTAAPSTGAAAPMRSMAPVLAGLGAAAAFFV
ncbi:hypothetical protein B5807_06907 [Epicoccum nigrum]|jgi:hypothetical protein|uniref:Phytocyanin domain-containing protein n=1 Tax=Epicoccum nigrum TaxID=105696 RepID=A0A1Y2LZ73_EPING|nr:hypothetical protein B5807_06907 [Epicoccum nigrum]